MKDLIELKSRGEEHNYLRRLVKPDGSESHTYMLKTSTYAMRGGLTDKKKKFVDPSGGPMIVEGEKLACYEPITPTVINISYEKGIGAIITLEI